jgi:hypothetical protein
VLFGVTIAESLVNLLLLFEMVFEQFYVVAVLLD